MVDQRPPNPISPADTKPSTTFVYVDTKTFREVVQRLTGLSESADPAGTVITTSFPHVSPAINNPKANIGVKKPAFKLHERRQYRGKLEIIKPPPSILKQQQQQQQRLVALSPRSRTSSPLSTPTRCLASLSLLEKESRGESTTTPHDLMIDAEEEEEKAIQGRRFYLHPPSPRSTSEKSSAGLARPELLNLFPLASPTATSRES